VLYTNSEKWLFTLFTKFLVSDSDAMFSKTVDRYCMSSKNYSKSKQEQKGLDSTLPNPEINKK